MNWQAQVHILTHMRKVKTDFTGAKNETFVTGRQVVGNPEEEGTANTQQLKRKARCKYFAAHF